MDILLMMDHLLDEGVNLYIGNCTHPGPQVELTQEESDELDKVCTDIIKRHFKRDN